MEGVLDHTLRNLLTAIGGYDYCTTEFVRVVSAIIPEKVYYRYCPELKCDGITASGTPVRVQLLGQSPGWLAENAYKACKLGSPGIDLNFGCPAKTVNRHKGGAVLLKEPETIYKIIRQVRLAVPDHLSVSAKIRLGYEDKSLLLEIAKAVEEGRATELAVHARTKKEGYKPPAHWHYIKKIKESISIPVIANGEIWCLKDYQKCVEESGCEDIMLGRGGLAQPNLAQVIKYGQKPFEWGEVKFALKKYCQMLKDDGREGSIPNLIKQWTRFLKHVHPEADDFFQNTKRITSSEEMLKAVG